MTRKVEYFQYYIDLTEASTSVEALQASFAEIDFLDQIPDAKGDYAYAEGKWTIKELVQHLIDTERIFTYRALSMMRNPSYNLPGYDHDAYADASDVSHLSLSELVADMRLLRQSTLSMFEKLSKSELETEGTANNIQMQVGDIGMIIAGHVVHHNNVIRERYLS